MYLPLQMVVSAERFCKQLFIVLWSCFFCLRELICLCCLGVSASQFGLLEDVLWLLIVSKALCFSEQ